MQSGQPHRSDPATHAARRLGLTLLVLACATLVTGCQSKRSPAPARPTTTQVNPPAVAPDALAARRGPRLTDVRAEPSLRIRIDRDLQAASLGEPGPVTVGPGQADRGKAQPRSFQGPVRISHDGQGFILTQTDGSAVRWRLSTLSVSSSFGRTALNAHPYPGDIELVALRNKDNSFTGRFDAVNRVGMEAYLPGVLSKELYPTWDPKAYRAQAVAARSYAIWEMSLPSRRAGHFDLESTTASQAYIGDKASDKARDAVRDTRGQVLVYDNRVLPAFYSSCSGGLSQDAVAAWPDKVDELAPLRGREHGGWGSISNRYRWGPVTRSRAALSRRIADWGRANKHPIAALNLIESVTVEAQNAVGRPTRVRVTDRSGQSYSLLAEQLRTASNRKTPGLPAIDSSNLVFSSHATYAVSSMQVTITGRGFGHGVGLCQWGAQHMASMGNSHNRILGFYYPGSAIQKAY